VQVRQESTKQPTPARSPTRTFSTVFPNLRDHTDDFMTWDHQKNRTAPFVVGLINIRMADATVGNLDQQVVSADMTPLK
jgi:hypothetical protein